MTVYVLEWGRGFREKWMGLTGYPKGQTKRLQLDLTPEGAGRFPLDVAPARRRKPVSLDPHRKMQAGAVEGGSSGSCLSHLLP